MAISIDWGTKVINIPKNFMTLVQSSPIEIRELDLLAFRLALKDLEDSDEGMCNLDTHTHNTSVVLAGITYAHMISIINGYTVTFEDGQYAVNAVGANSNLLDVKNPNQVSLRCNNSAGLIVSDNIDMDVVKDALFLEQDIETGLNFLNTMRLVAAASAGKLSGANTNLVKILSALTGSKERIKADVDEYGNRLNITLDLS